MAGSTKTTTPSVEHEALEFTALLAHATARHRTLAKRPDFQKAMTSIGDQLVKGVDGQVKTDLQIALAGLKGLA